MKTRIGILSAVTREFAEAIDALGEPVEVVEHGIITVMRYDYEKNELILARAGMGEIAAAACTQLLISCYHVDVLLNFGVVGGLTDEMSLARVCIVEKAVHYDMDSSSIDPVVPAQYEEYPDIYLPTSQEYTDLAVEAFPELKRVICASADKFVADPARKRELHELYGASVCDMESAAVILTCNRNDIPVISIKIVSDAVMGGAAQYEETVCYAAKLCMVMVKKLLQIIKLEDLEDESSGRINKRVVSFVRKAFSPARKLLAKLNAGRSDRKNKKD